MQVGIIFVASKQNFYGSNLWFLLVICYNFLRKHSVVVFNYFSLMASTWAVKWWWVHLTWPLRAFGLSLLTYWISFCKNFLWKLILLWTYSWRLFQAAGLALLKSLVLMCLEPGYPRTDGLTPVSTELFPFNSLAMKFLWCLVESKYVKNRWFKRIFCQVTSVIHICTNTLVEAMCLDEWVLIAV